MSTPDYLSLLEPARRAQVIAAIKICEGEPGKKKDGEIPFTDHEWANVWIHRFMRGKLKEAEQEKRTQEIATAQRAIDVDFPEE